MNRARVAFVPLALLGVWLASANAAMPAERSVSSSRQFIVYGTDVRLRGAICDLAEQSKRDCAADFWARAMNGGRRS